MFTHKMLIAIGYKFMMAKTPGFGCGVAFKELNSNCCNGEYPDIIGFYNGGSYLIEVKVSRSDFFADKKKSFRQNPEKGMGKFRFYMCPWGMIKPEDLPENWGLIWVNHTLKPKIMVNPYRPLTPGNIYSGGFKQNLQAENELMYSALRRLQLRGHVESIYENFY